MSILLCKVVVARKRLKKYTETMFKMTGRMFFNFNRKSEKEEDSYVFKYEHKK